MWEKYISNKTLYLKLYQVDLGFWEVSINNIFLSFLLILVQNKCTFFMYVMLVKKKKIREIFQDFTTKMHTIQA